MRAGQAILDASHRGLAARAPGSHHRSGGRRTRRISDPALQARFGIALAPLGGAPASGAGEIAGTVYLDANYNGRLDAGEAGAPNVTVVLDGRFSVQTDSNGRFDFPVVAAGHHVLTVISDNLPLPWTLPNAGRTEIEVATRGRAEASIGAQRPR